MKTSLAWLFYFLGIRRFAAWWHRNHVVILTYHDICEVNAGSIPVNTFDLDVPRENFLKQIAYLRRRYHVISLREFLEANASGKQLPDYSVVLTFDDGYRSFLTIAPLLLNYKLPATLFLITEMIRQEEVGPESIQAHADRFSWTEVQTLDDHNLFDFGSHTCSHPSLTSLTPEAVDNELHASLNEIRRKVKNLVPALAYPNGAYSGLLIEKIVSAGYACGVTIEPGPNNLGTDPYCLRRQTIRGKDDKQMFAARLSCLTTWLYSSRGIAQASLNRIGVRAFPATTSFGDGGTAAEIE